MGGVIYSMMSIECHNSDSLTHRQEVSWSIIVATLLTSFASLGFEYRFKITWIHFAPQHHNATCTLWSLKDYSVLHFASPPKWRGMVAANQPEAAFCSSLLSGWHGVHSGCHVALHLSF